MNSFLAVIVTTIISFILTPFVIKLAHRIGAIDVPKDDRRVHSVPIPRIGGLAIYFASLVGIIFFSNLSSQKIIGFIIGSSIIVGTGFIDDLRPLKAKTKLLLQILAAMVIYYFGFRISFFTNFFNPVEMVFLKSLSFPITVLWIVGVTNTINLIDGLDGLAAGVSLIVAITLAYVTLTFNRFDIFMLSLILIGSLLGFLPYNFNPAKIFMGDTGALFLGFTLAAITIDGVMKTVSTVVIFLPILALGLPLFDTSFAIFRRIKDKKPIMSPDKGHLHHRLLSLGLNQKRAVLTLYLTTSMLGISVISLTNSRWLAAYISLGIAIITVLVPIIKTEKRKKNEKN
jgi:UDP-GlcNAc:undecaprenyl-phosphate GlcNAc-1-phosphate transferase